LYCPDCGDEIVESDSFCQYCGYPSSALRKRLKAEQDASIGWAEKIIGSKPVDEKQIPPEDKLQTFVDVKDPEPEEDEDSRLRCESCASVVDYGMMCPECGDKLPTLGANDNFFISVIRYSFRFIVAPAHFARNFPYPTKGGTMQAVWVPAILSGLYILTLPATKAYVQPRLFEFPDMFGLALIGMTLYILLIPVLLFVTGGLNHWVAVLLGGQAAFRRTLRITGAGLTILLVLGLVRNIGTALLFLINPELEPSSFIRYNAINASGLSEYRTLVYITIVIAGWYHAWLIAGLHRLSWWKTLIHFIATYVTFTWWAWLIVFFGIPVLLIG